MAEVFAAVGLGMCIGTGFALGIRFVDHVDMTIERVRIWASKRRSEEV